MKKLTIENIVKIFLISNPFLDIFTAFGIHMFDFPITIGIIFRFIFCLVSFFYLFFLYRGKQATKIRILLIILISYLLSFAILVLVLKSPESFWYEMQGTFRSFYFLIILLLFWALVQDDKKIIPKNYLYIIYLIYLGGVFIPSLLGIGFDSYEVTKSGSIGFFNSANEIGAILSILMPLFLYYSYKKRNILLFLLFLFILLYVLLSIGTKGPLLSFIIIALAFIIYCLYHLFKKKKFKQASIIIGASLLLIIGGIYFLPKTTFYKNIRVHLDFLEVNNISDIFKSPKLIDHFIFSSRLKFLSNTADIYQEAYVSEKLLGIGYTDQNEELKMIEMDYADIFFHHGIIGFILYMTIYIFFLKQAIKNHLHDKDSLRKLAYFLAIFLSIILSLITGHVLTAPAVSIFVALLLIYPKKEEQENEKKALSLHHH